MPTVTTLDPQVIAFNVERFSKYRIAQNRQKLVGPMLHEPKTPCSRQTALQCTFWCFDRKPLWCSDIREECLTDDSSGSALSPKDYEKENRQLRRELAEKEKEISFLKKAAAFFAKELA